MHLTFRYALASAALFCLVQIGWADDAKPKPAAPAPVPAPVAAKPAQEMKFKAVLIWGTDGEKPKDEEMLEGEQLKDLDDACKNKLKRIFKWQNYYSVAEQPFHLKIGEKKRIQVSKKCEIEVEQKDNEGLAVELIGKGKSVKKVKHAMPLTEWLILGGDDKNANAWFVIIKPE
jgi:hypothetical protein